MEAKTVSSQTKEVQKRFFEAIERLISMGRLAGLQTFCDDHGLHRAKYSNLRSAHNNPEHNARYKFIDIDALVFLVQKYGIAAEWLLTGKGKMLN